MRVVKRSRFGQRLYEVREKSAASTPVRKLKQLHRQRTRNRANSRKRWTGRRSMFFLTPATSREKNGSHRSMKQTGVSFLGIHQKRSIEDTTACNIARKKTEAKTTVFNGMFRNSSKAIDIRAKRQHESCDLMRSKLLQFGMVTGGRIFQCCS